MLLLLLGMVTALFAARVASWQTRPVQEPEQHIPAAVTKAPSIEQPSKEEPKLVRAHALRSPPVALAAFSSAFTF